MRDELVKRLRHKGEWTNQRPYFHAHDKSLEAANQIEADGRRIAELEAELAEQCRLHGMGSEREARQLARIAELEAFQQQAIKQVCELAREAGEAKGKLEGSEMPGIVDGWREKCERLEKAMVFAALPLEAMLLSGSYRAMSKEMQKGIEDGVEAIRRALGDSK